MKTYSREAWNDAQYLWESGDFSDEWKPWRHCAAMAGIIYPPEGTKWDSWEDDSPSQRAMVIRAIRETPALLKSCIPGARSWGQVIERLLRARDEWRDGLDAQDREIARRRLEDPTSQQPMSTVAGLFDRVAASLGYVRINDPTKGTE